MNIIKTAITNTVEDLFQRHNIPVPPNWTYAQIVTDILGDDMTLRNVSSVLQNITQLGPGCSKKQCLAFSDIQYAIVEEDGDESMSREREDFKLPIQPTSV